MKYYRCVLALFLCFPALSNSAQCNAGFDYTPSSSRTFQFAAAGSNPLAFRWSFGDGDSSNFKNPQHTFADTGWFSVCLHITDSATCNADSCIAIHIDTCFAYFTYTYHPDLLQPEEPIYFFYDGSFGEQPGTTYLWSFGTGDYSTQQNQSLVYETADAGPEKVCLTISNAVNGCSSTYCHTIFVDALCGADTFGYTMQGRTVNFTSWICGYWNTIAWDFGDGSTASQTTTASHTFSNATDSFYVCLTVIFDSVCRDFVPCTAIYCQPIKFNNNMDVETPAFSKPAAVLLNISAQQVIVSFTSPNDFEQIEMLDLQGRMLYTAKVVSNLQPVEISELARGMYLVVAENKSGQKQTLRFVRQ